MNMCIHLKGLERDKVIRWFLRSECAASADEGLTLLNRKRSEWAILLRDASVQGKYRYQLFDEAGLNEHCTFDTLELAFQDAVAKGYCEIDMGALDRLFESNTWLHGTPH